VITPRGEGAGAAPINVKTNSNVAAWLVTSAMSIPVDPHGLAALGRAAVLDAGEAPRRRFALIAPLADGVVSYARRGAACAALAVTRISVSAANMRLVFIEVILLFDRVRAPGSAAAFRVADLDLVPGAGRTPTGIDVALRCGGRIGMPVVMLARQTPGPPRRPASGRRTLRRLPCSSSSSLFEGPGQERPANCRPFIVAGAACSEAVSVGRVVAVAHEGLRAALRPAGLT